MKLLILGNSPESGRFSKGADQNAILADLLTKELGEPVEIIPRQIWPNHRATEYVRRQIAETQPDAIYLQVIEYALSYPSTAVRLARFGAPGRWLARRSLLFADDQNLAYNRPVRALRYLLQATLGGDPHVNPDEGLATYLDIVRIAARQEDTFVMIKGPWGVTPWGATHRQRMRAEKIRYRVHTALRDLSSSLHLPYSGSDTPAWADPTSPFHKTKDEYSGDGVHDNALGAQRTARQHFDVLFPRYREYVAARG